MLKVSSKKVIVGYVPCPECQTPSAVHFPSGGKRENTPYLCCGTCDKTIQSGDVKQHIIDHYVPTLNAYSSKYGKDVSDEIEQVSVNKWAENPDLFTAKINGPVEESTELVADSFQPELEEVSELGEPVTIDNDTQEVIDKPKAEPKPKKNADDESEEKSSGGGLLLIGVLIVLVVGGFLVVRYLKRSHSDEGDNDE